MIRARLQAVGAVLTSLHGTARPTGRTAQQIRETAGTVSENATAVTGREERQAGGVRAAPCRSVMSFPGMETYLLVCAVTGQLLSRCFPPSRFLLLVLRSLRRLRLLPQHPVTPGISCQQPLPAR
jgi:hypothetical protein